MRSILTAAVVAALPTLASAQSPSAKSAIAQPPSFDRSTRAVTNWRLEAKDNLLLSQDQADSFASQATAPPVARCVKLNNYWCVKTAGWEGEIAADAEGHVAFASAKAGAAVAALLLKRYYIDYKRKTALAILSRWAPRSCGLSLAGDPTQPTGRRRPVSRAIAPTGIGATLRARWLAAHNHGFTRPVVSGTTPGIRRSMVADHVPRTMSAPTIAVGLGETTRPMTFDALLRMSPHAPPSRSMLGLERRSGGSLQQGGDALAGLETCGSDTARIASYAATASIGIATGVDGDLALFTRDGSPTPNLAAMMANMARVEIGPLAAKPELVAAGVAAAFAPGRNPAKP